MEILAALLIERKGSANIKYRRCTIKLVFLKTKTKRQHYFRSIVCQLLVAHSRVGHVAEPPVLSCPPCLWPTHCFITGLEIKTRCKELLSVGDIHQDLFPTPHGLLFAYLWEYWNLQPSWHQCQPKANSGTAGAHQVPQCLLHVADPLCSST